MVVDTGGKILALKRAGGFKSSTVAEGYVEKLLQQKNCFRQNPNPVVQENLRIPLLKLLQENL